ncbi:MAG: hypothetical protein IKF90_21300 [Parasporobacterium sp.]|nr:hypothetical protein [Parasporobacterium sp.]
MRSGEVLSLLRVSRQTLTRYVKEGYGQRRFPTEGRKYNCEIIVMSEAGSRKLDREEIFEEIVSLLHCYSMKLYSRRRLKKIREVLEDPEEAAETGAAFNEGTGITVKK